ncbi:MAG: hypothetical protein A2X34_06430 [Elusimicrobia bacterium GWC2_51_8]|nr:MAG: hypothetical protein A2X33_08255 [Elusimicrobia bacterium GWA2_51_34]OGR61256.1 MAG: hypothetical protein A2X34_06430 [Elusimicrobia bacterium GWC2_51_8]OGR86011.1 MAG: hypothetical protein A2021_05335 [Elusimicrobia bacterium GWF2_52_66]HAF94496.1 hypothetical protein [Elusimicrobiota bacterium]HCE98945.1 hypothetical protein [Elusimicrobiota bacterium]
MVQKILFIVFISAFFHVNSAAQENPGYDPRLIGSSPYTDPAYQDFIETSYGYLNPNNAIKARGGFRDALSPLETPSLKKIRSAPLTPQNASYGRLTGLTANPQEVPSQRPLAHKTASSHSDLPALPADYYKVTFAGDSGPIASFVKPLGRKGSLPGEYVFVRILPKERNYSGMLKEIAVSAGFRFSGEKTLYLKNARKIVVFGWVQSARLDAIYKNPKVAGMSVEKKSFGVPLKTRVKFTLKVPCQNDSGAFVSRFIKNLGSDKGFVSENISRLPSPGGSSKFTAFDVTGSISIEMVGELSRSPFVVSVESAL